MKNILTIARREAGAFFQSPMAYIVVGLFLFITAILFFPTFFIYNRAEMRGFFQALPILFSFFLPAVTMRMLAEEVKSGTLETLITLPVEPVRIIAGKYIAALLFLAAMLAPTLIYLILIAPAGGLDLGPVAGGYIGALFLGAAYAAAGLYTSAQTNNQIVAFVLSLGLCLVLTYVDKFMIFLPPVIVTFLQYFSAGYHFETISKGIIDSRSLIYFVSLSLVFLIGAVRGIEARR